MALNNPSKLGRPFKEGETVSQGKRVPLDLTQTEFSLLEKLRGKMPRATYLKDVLEKLDEGRLVPLGFDPANIGTDSLPLPKLGSVPGGPWEEVVANADTHIFSKDDVEELELQSKDIALRVIGQSMEGAGIPDHALVIFRPLPMGKTPRREPTLVQAILEDGTYWETIKTYNPPTTSHDRPRLTNGEGEDVPFPEGITQIRYAPARAMLVQLGG